MDSSFKETFSSVRNRTVALCANLETEDYQLQPVEFVSPPKWHLAHTTWFWETFVLLVHKPGYVEFESSFAYFFNSYYESAGERNPRPARGLVSRPTVGEVYAYRESVDSAMLSLLSELELGDEDSGELPSNEMLQIQRPSALYQGRAQLVYKLLALGLQHEQQHQELLVTDLKYSLSLNRLYPAVLDIGEYQEPGMHPRARPEALLNDDYERPALAPRGVLPDDVALQEARTSSRPINENLAAYLPDQTWITIPEGVYTIGYTGTGFSFDNELPPHKVYLKEYAVAPALVTNGEYLEFMESGGYQDFRYWHADGWTWVNENNITHPQYWVRILNDIKQYTLNGLQPVNPSTPVTHISLYEAFAFAEWRGMRLLTEAEWEIASIYFSWGQRWEWTLSAYLPYPGYEHAPGALGEYNGKFMINQMVLRGASLATPQGHSRPSYRNFFSADSRWQFTGIRLAKKHDN